MVKEEILQDRIESIGNSRAITKQCTTVRAMADYSSGARVLLFDVLRVIAICMVLYSHVLITMGPPFSEAGLPYIGIKNFYWATWGQIGVTLFLAVSGLSLEYNYGRRKVRVGTFYLRRILRIYPTYYMSLLLALVIKLAISLRAEIVYGKSFIFLGQPHFGDFILTMTGFNAFAGRWGGSLVWSSWFIGLIVTMYLLYPLISLCMKKYPLLSLGSLFVVSGVSRLITGHWNILPGNALEWFPPNRLFEFGIGVFLVRLLRRESLLIFNRVLVYIPLLTFFSSLSFPLFLVHDPLRRFIWAK
jgi:peptidoglycan/LPS O-acetylase OafA/YrhL